MAEKNVPRRHSLCLCHRDVVLLHRGDQISTQQTHVCGHFGRCECDRWQQKTAETLERVLRERRIADRIQQFEPHGEDEDENERKHEVGDCQKEEQHPGGPTIKQTPCSLGGNEANRYGDDQRQELGVEKKLDGDGETLLQSLGNRLGIAGRTPEVACDDAAEPSDVSHRHRIVEMELSGLLLDAFGPAGASAEGRGGVAREQLKEQEGEERDAKHHDEQLHKLLAYESHACSLGEALVGEVSDAMW